MLCCGLKVFFVIDTTLPPLLGPHDGRELPAVRERILSAGRGVQVRLEALRGMRLRHLRIRRHLGWVSKQHLLLEIFQQLSVFLDTISGIRKGESSKSIIWHAATRTAVIGRRATSRASACARRATPEPSAQSAPRGSTTTQRSEIGLKSGFHFLPK